MVVPLYPSSHCSIEEIEQEQGILFREDVSASESLLKLETSQFDPYLFVIEDLFVNDVSSKINVKLNLKVFAEINQRSMKT